MPEQSHSVEPIAGVPVPPDQINKQSPDPWHIVSRWAEYEGEALANLLRIVAIGVFYAIELVNYCGLNLGPLSVPATSGSQYHATVTALAAAGALTSLATLYLLRARIFPAALKFFTSGCDVLLLTTAMLAGDGPRSAMLVGYFLVIPLATLRFNLRLVWCTTLGTMAGYLALLGFARWSFQPEHDLTVPRYEQIIVLASIGLEGVMLGQVVRQVRRLAADFARRVVAAHQSASEPRISE